MIGFLYILYTYTLPDGRATTWKIQDGGTMHADESNKPGHARRITSSWRRDHNLCSRLRDLRLCRLLVSRRRCLGGRGSRLLLSGHETREEFTDLGEDIICVAQARTVGQSKQRRALACFDRLSLTSTRRQICRGCSRRNSEHGCGADVVRLISLEGLLLFSS